MQANSLRHLVELESLPTLPVFVQRLLGVLQEDSSTAKGLEMIIEKDPAISARILRVANSSFFGMSGRVATLERAITLLGTRLIQSLALSVSLLDTLAYDREVGQLPWKAYWIHSFACASACTKLVQIGVHTEVKEEAFMCGLLHDLGKPLLWLFQADAYQKVLNKIQQDGTDAYLAESAVLGFHHGEIGGEVTKWWKLPKAIHSAILYHHEASPSELAAQLVKLADWAAKSEGFCDHLGFVSPTPNQPAGAANLDQMAEVAEYLKEKQDEIKEIAELLM